MFAAVTGTTFVPAMAGVIPMKERSQITIFPDPILDAASPQDNRGDKPLARLTHFDHLQPESRPPIIPSPYRHGTRRASNPSNAMSTVLLTRRHFSVEHRVYTTPKGEMVERDVVVHPGAVVMLPILDDGRIVMIRNHRYTVERELWELPAGTREPDESPIETARRELIEETGYQAGRMEPLVEFFASPGVMTERMFAFIATELTHVGQNLVGSERIIVEPLDSAEVRRRLIAGDFEDGKTIATLGTFFLREMSKNAGC
jgi:ADP-ribose pyrophosphatase